MKNKTFTKHDLKYHVEQTGGHFFERSSMKFFGDTMANYGVRPGQIVENTADKDELTDVWILYRRRPVKHGLHDSAYFDKQTFKRVFKKK